MRSLGGKILHESFPQAPTQVGPLTSAVARIKQLLTQLISPRRMGIVQLEIGLHWSRYNWSKVSCRG
jgi:hypothetical protein